MQVGAEIYSMKRQSSPCPNAANRFSNMPFLQKHCMFQWFSGNCGAISCDCNASGTLMVMRDGGGANCHWNPCPRVIKNRWAIKKGWVQRSSGLPCLFMRLLIVCNQLLECRVPSTYICMCMYELPKGLG
ncbi:unnamed protein product [Durusdinium trenchii]|uniref:Uncharacterized protein n=1 Tax=Durusdinium trenchii TaxID=1381693 RepID=A0ABP0M2Q3_9DINO